MQISISILKKKISSKKKSSLHSKSGSPQKTQNICIHFKPHQDRLTFLGEAYGLLNSHLEQVFCLVSPIQGHFTYYVWSG